MSNNIPRMWPCWLSCTLLTIKYWYSHPQTIKLSCVFSILDNFHRQLAWCMKISSCTSLEWCDPFAHIFCVCSIINFCLLCLLFALWNTQYHCDSVYLAIYIPYNRKVLVNLLFSSIWRKVWQSNRSSKRLIIVSTNLDGFSLANHRRFTKFAKRSRYTVWFYCALTTCASWNFPIFVSYCVLETCPLPYEY